MLQRPHDRTFKSIALVGNAKDLRVAECMLSLAEHFHARGQRALVDPGVGLEFPPDIGRACPENRVRGARRPHRRDRRRRHAPVRGPAPCRPARCPCSASIAGRLGFLTDVSPASMLEDVESVLAGRYTEDRRSLLSARLERPRSRRRARARLERRGAQQARHGPHPRLRDLDQRALRQLPRRRRDRHRHRHGLDRLRAFLRRSHRRAGSRCLGAGAHLAAHA